MGRLSCMALWFPGSESQTVPIRSFAWCSMLLARRDAAGHECGSERLPNSNQQRTRRVDPVWIWGIPFAALSMAETVSAIEDLIEAGRPSFFITANVNYAMLTHENPDLRAINERAAFILADGAPLVWASRLQGSPLPERVAGSDLIIEMSAQQRRKGIAFFFWEGPTALPRKLSPGCVNVFRGYRWLVSRARHFVS